MCCRNLIKPLLSCPFQDKRYMGCFNEDASDPDLPEVMWEASDPHSPQECNLACSEAGFDFAGKTEANFWF